MTTNGPGYKKAPGSTGISNPKAGPPTGGTKLPGGASGLPIQGKRDSRPGPSDNKQSAR